ncbi:zinc finger CCCH domain-containing protein 37 isoform X2 [Ziziphus jujuba]|uniref:Zinc finger CCCH domain-containing protein 37 isoform X2 n=1 Tax=Ziziphus jujuba TaxID=326968 RepID=A0ABM4AFK5_ZIZJJ|nr:zinc finger CCCH domain-containing protein 37 isoform X2 [Ziziphus jujuba]
MASHLYGYGGAASGAVGATATGGGGLSSVYSEAALRYLAASSSDSDSSKYSLADHHRMYLTHTTADALASYSSAADSLLSGVKRSAAEVLYHQTLLGVHNTIGQSEAWYSTNSLAKRSRYESASNLPIYPQRPGEKDCAHYMLTRTCKFGDSCKFDHPIWVPEGGIPDWKEYFIKTQRCKFGLRCKFNHPKDKTTAGSLENVDVAVLPERPFEPPCAFYLKTGNCKFGATCKFHHPKDVQILSNGQENGTSRHTEVALNTEGTFGAVHNSAAFTPALFYNSKELPIRPGEPDCPFYLKTGSCKYGATCRYNHPDRNAIHPPAAIGHTIIASPAASLNIGAVNPVASLYQTIDPRLAQPTVGVATIYPQRPGQIECDYYMKTGECKFGERCKYHHPIDRSAPTLSTASQVQQETTKLTLAGLPRREGSIICPYYMKTGTCKYGATCKFDHPPPGEAMAMATSQGTSTAAGGEANEEEKGSESIQEQAQ